MIIKCINSSWIVTNRSHSVNTLSQQACVCSLHCAWTGGSSGALFVTISPGRQQLLAARSEAGSTFHLRVSVFLSSLHPGRWWSGKMRIDDGPGRVRTAPCGRCLAQRICNTIPHSTFHKGCLKTSRLRNCLDGFGRFRIVGINAPC